jgi:hypothetical protein
VSQEFGSSWLGVALGRSCLSGHCSRSLFALGLGLGSWSWVLVLGLGLGSWSWVLILGRVGSFGVGC